MGNFLSGIKQFWIVWSPDGLTNPSVQHYNKDVAIQAADAMANWYPDKEFFVMSSVVCSLLVDAKRFSRRGAD